MQRVGCFRQMTEAEVLKEIAKLLWRREIEVTNGMKLMMKEAFITVKHPLGKAGLQEPNGPLNLLVKGKFYEVSVTKILLEE